MKIESLYEFIVLTHYLNFTTAANNLNMSQPTLSKHISELEQELDVELITRSKDLEMTAAGAAFLKDAIQIHHLYKDSVKRVRDIARQDIETLTIQEPYIVDLMSEILFKSVSRFKLANPYIMTKYYTERGRKSIELLEQGKIDIAMVIDCNAADRIDKVSEKKGLIFYPVIQEQLCVWLHEDHPLVSKEALMLEDLVHVPINMTSTRSFDPMRFAILDLFSRTLGVRPNLQTYSSETLNEFFMNTHDRNAIFLVSPAVAASPLLSMQRHMTSRLIDDERARITSYLVLREDYQKKAIDQFLETVELVVSTDIEHHDKVAYLEEIE
ncbi:LysR family transcriptional regulator [Raoultibacter phocaeensis]|uniref:LysR family transcriptional regulator n=1 Tax=Raoultibacter phocaeensis TaxID=2479841 RepID=UPI00111B5A8D|nr:LysR family transcriptional regulator [Raoultibacter phocaeensis]